jgi:hypothetical protein
MDVRVDRSQLQLDPLIAEAKRRARRRRVLVVLALVFAVSVAAATLALRPDRPAGSGSGAAPGSPAAAFHNVNWLGATVPGSVCRGTRPIHLRHGSAVARATRPSDGGWHEWPRIYLSLIRPATYGTLDGRSAAAITVGCTNGGGTADGFMAYADVIFVARHVGAPELIGVVKPHIRPWGQEQMASLIGVSFANGEVLAHEYFYGPADGTCCASGRAISVWKLSRGGLVREETVITRKPRQTPS